MLPKWFRRLFARHRRVRVVDAFGFSSGNGPANATCHVRLASRAPWLWVLPSAESLRRARWQAVARSHLPEGLSSLYAYTSYPHWALQGLLSLRDPDGCAAGRDCVARGAAYR